MPALAKKMSRPPKASLTSAATFSRSSRESTSALMVRTSLPMVRRTLAKSASLRPTTATRAPFSRKSFAVARPIPEVPPVTSAVFPFSILLVPPCLSGLLEAVHGIEHVAAVNQGSASVEIDGDAQRFCDFLIGDAELHGLGRVDGDATVAARCDGNRQGDQLADLGIEMICLRARAAEE